jgi:hypothetical protein
VSNEKTAPYVEVESYGMKFFRAVQIPVLFQNFPGDTEKNCEHPQCD